MGRPQEYLEPRLEHTEGVWVLDGSDFPKQGRKSAGVPEERRGYRSKTELALELLERALDLGHRKAGWVAADDAFGMSPSLRDGLAALGMKYVPDVPAGFTVWPAEPEKTTPVYRGRGGPPKPRLVAGQRRTMGERSAELPEEAWREITVAQGSQGPRTYQFSAQRLRPTSKRKPGEIRWVIWRRNLDGSEPRYYLSNAPDDTPLETLAYVGGSRWRIETEFETEKHDVGLDEYETRTWAATGVPSAAGDAAPGTVRIGETAAVADRGATAKRPGQSLPSEAPRKTHSLPAGYMQTAFINSSL